MVLKNWYKGTGGGSGDDNMFEDWTKEKMDKYDVDPMIYDHTIVADHPPILIDGYAKHRKYITMLFLWDKKKDLLLASKYDPILIGLGEAGVEREDDSSIPSLSHKSSNSKVSSITTNNSSPLRTKAKSNPEEEAKEVARTFLNLVMDREKEKEKEVALAQNEDLVLEHQSLSELMQLIDIYMKNIEYRRSRGSLTPDREEKINSQIDYITQIIEDRQWNKKRRREDDDSDSDRSNRNNTVS